MKSKGTSEERKWSKTKREEEKTLCVFVTRLVFSPCYHKNQFEGLSTSFLLSLSLSLLLSLFCSLSNKKKFNGPKESFSLFHKCETIVA